VRAEATNWWPLLRLGLRAPEYTLGDVLRMPKGLSLYARALQYDVPADTLSANVTAVRVPVTVVAGRYDMRHFLEVMRRVAAETAVGR
jgi:hypothetical protein